MVMGQAEMASRLFGRETFKRLSLSQQARSLAWKPPPPPPATRLYVWGCNLGGCLAAATHLEPVIKEPSWFPLEAVTVRKPFTTVTCGVDFSILLTGKALDFVYVGSNVGMSQSLSLFDAVWANEEVPDERLPWYTEQEDKDEYFHPGCGAFRMHVPMPTFLPVVQAAAGREHVVFLSKDNMLFVAGKDTFGQCGGKVAKTALHPPEIMALRPFYMGGDDSSVKKEFAAKHVVLQQLGHDAMDCLNIEQVVCGLDHTLLRSADGYVYTFGLNTDGQCGQASDATQCDLHEVSGIMRNAIIRDVASSADSCAALDNEGRLFTWGNNEQEHLLLRSTEPQVTAPRLVDELLLREALRGIRPIAVGMGGCYGALLDEHGSVWTWGRSAALGQGPEVHVSHWPRRVNIPARVVQVRTHALHVLSLYP